MNKFLELLAEIRSVVTGKKFWQEIIMMTAGLMVGAAAVYYFLIPSKIVVGTISGLALVLNSLIPVIKVSHFVLIMNVVLVFLAVFIVGKEFGLKSIFASILLGPCMDLWELICPYSRLVAPGTVGVMGDPWFDLCCFVILLSASQAFLFRINASTGGLDIIAMIINKFTHIEIGTCVSVAGIIVCLSAFLIPDNSFRMVIIGIIGTWLNGLAIDYFMASLNRKKRVCIVSKDYEAIRRYIIEELVRGCTLYEIRGGYTGEKSMEIQVLLTQFEYGKLLAFIQEKDLKAFMTAGNCSEVHGKWFPTSIQKEIKSHER